MSMMTRAMSSHTGARSSALYFALFLSVGILLSSAGPLAAQRASQSIGSGVQFQGFSFSDELGLSKANLLLVPIAYRLPVGTRLSFDLYGAWAEGKVEREGEVFSLSGIVDTQLRSSFAASPWATLSVAVNLPTGNATHDEGEGVVASIFATDLLGFREASWGSGLAVTSGIATARRVGQWGLGAGFSYRVAGEFEPRADTTLAYEPGNETRVRLALDRNIGSSGKFTTGATFQQFTSDQLGGRNLFQAGNRLRVDLAYAFRLGASTWSLQAANLWREQGDVILDLIGGDGQVVGDTTFTTGTQNLLVAGLAASFPLRQGISFRPSVDARVQTREEGTGGGWIVGGGADIPIRLSSSLDIFPRGQLLVGSIEGQTGEMFGLWGGEVGVTLRWRP